MNESIKQIARRLSGLRESLNYSSLDMATKCGVELVHYEEYESGEADIPMSALYSVSKALGVEITALLSGSDPHVLNYSVTRKGQGIAVERHQAYRYESLSPTFQHRRAEPFIVEVMPGQTKDPVFSTHDGQEFNYVLEGELKLFLGIKEIILAEGDSIYFDPKLPHAMQAMNNKKCKFLATIIA